MSITFSVENYEELVNADLSIEAKKARDNWYNCPRNKDFDYEEKCWEAYDELVKPIECKYELNMSNARVKDLFDMLGLEYDYCGSFDGGELVIFISKLKALKDSIQGNPSEFSTPTVESRGENGAHIIDCGVRDGYWESRLDKLVELAESTTKIQWC